MKAMTRTGKIGMNMSTTTATITTTTFRVESRRPAAVGYRVPVSLKRSVAATNARAMPGSEAA